MSVCEAFCGVDAETYGDQCGPIAMTKCILAAALRRPVSRESAQSFSASDVRHRAHDAALKRMPRPRPVKAPLDLSLRRAPKAGYRIATRLEAARVNKYHWSR